MYTWNLGNVWHCNCKPRSSSLTSINSSVAPSILSLDWQVMLHSSNTHDSELQYAIFRVFPSGLIQYHHISWMPAVETILPSAPLRLKVWFAVKVRPEKMKIKPWSMHKNVHTFQQPLFTWTIGPHAHLAGIPHSPVAARVLCSYHILTLSGLTVLCETKRNETKRNGTLRNGTLRNGTLRNGTLRNEVKTCKRWQAAHLRGCYSLKFERWYRFYIAGQRYGSVQFMFSKGKLCEWSRTF